MALPWRFAMRLRHARVLGRQACIVCVPCCERVQHSLRGGLDQFVGFGDSTMDSGYFRYGSTGGLFVLAPDRRRRSMRELHRRSRLARAAPLSDLEW
jgi:hypothetical protein